MFSEMGVCCMPKDKQKLQLREISPVVPEGVQHSVQSWQRVDQSKCKSRYVAIVICSS